MPNSNYSVHIYKDMKMYLIKLSIDIRKPMCTGMKIHVQKCKNAIATCSSFSREKRFGKN